MVNTDPVDKVIADAELDRKLDEETEAEALGRCPECGAVPELDGGHERECAYFGGDKLP